MGQAIKIQQVLQREGHRLHGERACCYASDLIMRQYEREKQIARKEEKTFSFRSMKPVYVIVIMENSPTPFLDVSPYYMHRKITTYDSHAQIAELSNIVYISLDTFQQVVQNIDTPLHAWLTFLSAWKAEDIMNFFSEALLMMDHSTAEYMCEEMKKEIAQLKDENEQLLSENATLRKQLALRN